jgi:PAS domain S-box-containing protein
VKAFVSTLYGSRAATALLGRARAGNLARLRLAFLAFAGFNTVVVTIMITAAGRPGLRLAGAAAALGLLALWIVGFRRERFALASEVLEAAAIFATVCAIGQPEKTYGIFYTALFFRSLYGSVPRTIARAGLYLAVLISGVVATQASIDFSVQIAPHAFAFLFTGLVMRLVAVTLARYERALVRERALRKLASELAGTQTDDEMGEVVIDALRTLVMSDPTARVTVSRGDVEALTVVAAAGSDADIVGTGRIYPSRFPQEWLDDLLAGRPVHPQPTGGPQPISFSSKRAVTLVPLRIGGHLAGLLAYSSDRGVPDDLTEVLGTLGSQVSVWLERSESAREAGRIEDRFRALVQNGTDIVALGGPDGRIEYISPSVEAVLGYRPAEITGKDGFDFVHPDDVDDVMHALFHVVQTPGTQPPVLCRAITADGEVRSLEMILSNQLDNEALGAIVVNARDVTERRRVEDALVETDRERARLLRHLVGAQEEERKLIAGDIHDDSIQVMSAAAIRLGMLRKYLKEPKPLELLDKLETSVESSISRLRQLMFSLRPPALDRDGLASAVREQLEMVAEDCGFEWTLASDLESEPSSEVRVNIFRIAQEALANIRKHAHASSVTVRLIRVNDGILTSITDDGRGFNKDAIAHHSARGHLGITSMRERAELAGGYHRITSTPSGGTRVEFWMPDVAGGDGDDQELERAS